MTPIDQGANEPCDIGLLSIRPVTKESQIPTFDLVEVTEAESAWPVSMKGKCIWV